MGEGTAVTERERAGGQRAIKLAQAYDAVAEVLEEVDLEAEPRQANELVTALAAIDRAYEITTGASAATE